MIWKVEEERTVDITKTLDKALVWLLFGSISVFSATVVLTQWIQLPEWISILGMVVSLGLLAVVAAAGSILGCRREEIYQWWIKRKVTGRVSVRMHNGRIADFTKYEDPEEKTVLYDIWVKLDGKIGGKVRFHGVHVVTLPDDSVSPAAATSDADSAAMTTVPRTFIPKIGNRVRVMIASGYSSRGRELVRKTVLHQNIPDDL